MTTNIINKKQSHSPSSETASNPPKWISKLECYNQANYSYMEVLSKSNDYVLNENLAKLDESVGKNIFELTSNARQGRDDFSNHYQGPVFELASILKNLDKFSTLDKDIQLKRLDLLQK